MSELLYYTPDEVAKIMRVTTRTIQQLAEQDKLPGAIKFGKQWRISRAKLAEYLNEERLPKTEGEEGA
jgi:excisionase family DNA binding protein